MTTIERIMQFLHDFPGAVCKVAAQAAAEASVQMLRNTEPPYSYVSRAVGFPNGSFTTSTGKVIQGYYSQAQFNYVHAAIADGRMHPGQDNRTHNLRDTFYYVQEGNKYVIKNPQIYAQYVVGNRQTTMHSIIGWRKVLDTIVSWGGVARAAVYGINNWMKGHPET